MWRWSLLAALVLLAGCAAPPETEVASTDLEIPEEIVGGMIEGTVWLPPSQSQEREETLVELPANHSGMHVVASLALGSLYGPAELPITTADVLVELRAPSGDVLGDVHLGTQTREGTIDATTAEAGPHVLAILSYGGSDGSANGDHVHFHAEVAPPETSSV